MKIVIDNNELPLQKYLRDNGINTYVSGNYDTILYPCVQISTDPSLMHYGLNAYDNIVTIILNYGEDDKQWLADTLQLIDEYEPQSNTDYWHYDTAPYQTNTDTNTLSYVLNMREIIQWRPTT